MIPNRLKILAWLLHNANTNPVFIAKKDFYEIKDTILQKHGFETGLHDLQHIQKICWTCDGTGAYPHPSWTRTCLNCGGTGLYTNFWVRLDIWKLGKYEFHKPVLRIYEKTLAQLYLTKKISPRNIINDYINHRTGSWNSDCSLALFLLYKPKTFFRHLGRVGFSRRTPIAFLFSSVFELRLFYQRVKFKTRNVKRRLFVKQDDNMDIPL